MLLPPHRSDPQRAWQIGLLAIVVVLTGIAVSLFIAMPRNGETAAASAEASSTLQPSATATSAAASSTARSSASDTPIPASATPSPELISPATLISGNWVSVTVKLNLRREPGLSAGPRAELQPGDVLLVMDGPTTRDGYSWYHVLTLAGAEADGWIASGPLDEPFATDLAAAADVFSTCGRVEAGGVVDGLRFNWTLHDVEQGLFDLLAAVEGTGCVNLVASATGIQSYVDASVTACGEPRWEDDALWLVPSVAGDVVAEGRVQHRVRVSDALLTENAILDEDGRSNRHVVMGLASEATPPFGCVHARVTETGSGRDTYFMTDTEGCFTLEQLSADYALMRARPDGTLFRFERRPGGGVQTIPLGAPTWINVTAMYSASDGQFFSLVGSGTPCGA